MAGRSLDQNEAMDKTSIADIWKIMETDELHRRLAARLSILEAALTNEHACPDILQDAAGLLLWEARDIQAILQERSQ